jgi:nonsense-mediated mRNA decay protein 3
MLAKKTQSTFGGELKQSSSMVGMKEGREITRVTILLRLPEYQIGDFLKINKKYYQIQRLTGQKIYLIGLSDWEEKSVENKDLKNFYVYNAKDYCKQMILVSQTSKSVQLMDKKNYSISEVNKPKDITFQDNDVDVFFKDDSIFLIPKKT